MNIGTTTATVAAIPELARQRINRYIEDLIALEASGVTGMKDMIEEATDPQDIALFTQHLAETETQKRRLEVRLAELGGVPNRLKDIVNKIGIAASDLLSVGKDAEDKATRNVIQAFTVENAEIGAYESLIAAASAVGDTQTAALAKEIQAEEKAAAQKLFARIAPLAATAIVIGISEGRD